MPYLRRDKLTRKIKPKSGDHPISGEDKQHPLSRAEEVDYTSLNVIESVYDDEVVMHLLEETESNLQQLEDLIDKRLSTFKVLVDPDVNFPLVKAISTLHGDLSLVLDADIVVMATDIAQDGAAHIQGFDPVAAVLGIHGGSSTMPNAPEPGYFADCDEMQDMSDIPSPGDTSYDTKPIDEIHIKKEETNWLDIYTKLWRILKYFPGVDIKSFLKKIRNRWTRRPVNRAIGWVECHMIKPGWFLLSGDPQSCSESEKATDPPDVDDPMMEFADEDLDATGFDCIEASMTVLDYLEKSHSGNEDLALFGDIRKERDEHEALKFGTVVNNIKNKDRFEDRIEQLYDKSKTIPRYKKRFYDHKDSFDPVGQRVQLTNIL